MQNPITRYIIAAAVMLPLFCLSVYAAVWYESYDSALKALEKEEWAEAIRWLNLSLEDAPQSNTRAKTYGMRFIAYFPYLYMAIAYQGMGQLDAAMQALETELRQREIAKSPEHKELLLRVKTEIADSMGRVEEEKQALARQVVQDNMALAVRLEKQGDYDQALVAIAKVLAVAPDFPDALAARDRLLSAVSKRQAQKERQARFNRLKAQGENALAAQEFDRAASLLSQALDVMDDRHARELLEQAQQGLRNRLQQQTGAMEKQQLIRKRLMQALQSQTAGNYLQALNHVETVLAVDASNTEALNLRAVLLDLIDKQDTQRLREQQVNDLLRDADRLLAGGAFDLALSKANMALAIDPANGDALRTTTRIYKQLSRILLDTSRAPPALSFQQRGEEQMQGAYLVYEPDLVLSGTAYANSPVQVSLAASGRALPGVKVSSRAVHGVWVTHFQAEITLAPGKSSIAAVAANQQGMTARDSLTFWYRAPFYRTRWFPLATSTLVLVALLAVVVWRRKRRTALRLKRFNPYIAGAPILRDRDFFGRRKLLDYVLRRISNNSIMLYGERRIGKTSLLHSLKRTLSGLDDPDHQYLPVFIDLQGTPEIRFFATLAQDIFTELDRMLDGLQPDPAVEGDTYTYRLFVKDMKRVLKKITPRYKKKLKIVLLIDEVDELNAYNPRINQKLRSLFMKTFADSLVAVVAGVAIKKQWDREGSPWYNFFQEVEVAAFSRQAAQDLIEKPVQGVFSYEKGVIAEIMRQARFKPYMIQLLCSKILDRMHHQGRYRITLQDVDFVSRNDTFGRSAE